MQERASGRLQIHERGVCREIRLHRPLVHNALDEELIAGLTAVFLELAGGGGAVSGSLPGSGAPPGRTRNTCPNGHSWTLS